jgi:membrane-associated phospholipid phosphatase
MASRELAIVNTAVFDAVDAANGLPFRPYRYDGPGVPEASPRAAAGAAASRVLSRLEPGIEARAPALAARIRALYDRDARGGGPPAALVAGIALGEQRADAIMALRAHDGFNVSPPPYWGSAKSGAWRSTPPDMAPGLLPQWATMPPWTMRSPSQFRPPGPPPMGASKWAGSVNMTQALGSAKAGVRATERTQIALFWSDADGTETPPGHWIDIGAGIAAARHLELMDEARLMALLSTAEADAAIAAWDAKYAYNAWRPVTAIREAAAAGSTAVTPDPAWTPLLATPPFPEYISGHSAFSAASAAVLARFFGSDQIPFSARSDAPELRSMVRRFAGLSAAAEEAGMSRIYGGIHFRFSHLDGAATGEAIGRYVFDNFFQPQAAIATSFSAP